MVYASADNFGRHFIAYASRKDPSDPVSGDQLALVTRCVTRRCWEACVDLDYGYFSYEGWYWSLDKGPKPGRSHGDLQMALAETSAFLRGVACGLVHPEHGGYETDDDKRALRSAVMDGVSLERVARANVLACKVRADACLADGGCRPLADACTGFGRGWRTFLNALDRCKLDAERDELRLAWDGMAKDAGVAADCFSWAR